MNKITHYLKTLAAKREAEADPQWPGSAPIQLVEHARRDSLGHRVLNVVMAVMLVAVLLCVVWGVL
jgi:hypothetical protein